MFIDVTKKELIFLSIRDNKCYECFMAYDNSTGKSVSLMYINGELSSIQVEN